MRSLFIFSFFVFITWSCSSPKIAIDKLIMKQGKYYSINSKNPYAGKVISKFDNGNIASIIEMKNGVPNGKWVAYGYKNEVVQEGSYNPIDVSNDALLMNSTISRLNVCTTKEGAIEFTDIFLVTDTPDKKVENIKAQVSTFLKSRSIVIKGDSINEIKYVKGELE